ncbi:MAG TPA: sugar ABC transporter permease [Micromonosporaceae bacterium]|nr:sugar ABC transporter permease [Micromonosporaceae bacterium]
MVEGSVKSATGLSQSVRAVVGLVLLLPALLALLWSYVLPTASAVALSVQADAPGRSSPGADGSNYDRIPEFFPSVQSAILTGLLPIAAAIFVAPLLAFVADRAGRTSRLVTRGLLALPLAAYAPVPVAMGWQRSALDDSEFSVRSFIAITSFGLVVAVAATLYLSALRKRGPRSGVGPAMMTVGGLLALGIVAASLQTYVAPALLRGLEDRGGEGGASDGTTSPLYEAVELIRQVDLGASAALWTLLFAALALLGVIAVLLLLATRSRIEYDGKAEQGKARAGFVAATGLALLILVVVVGYAVLRPLFALGSGEPLLDSSLLPKAMVNTWLPPLISALVSVLLAAIAGFGIGVMRPLGRWSEALLLPFAPWLFLGAESMSVTQFLQTNKSEPVTLLLDRMPPVWLSVPALVAFTLLFRGQAARWRAGEGFLRAILLPTGPMLLLTMLFTWLVTAQGMLWQWAAGTSPDTVPMLMANQMAMSMTGVDNSLLVIGVGLPAAFFLLAFGALQLGYLDRLAIRVGRETPATPSEHPGPGAEAS